MGTEERVSNGLHSLVAAPLERPRGQSSDEWDMGDVEAGGELSFTDSMPGTSSWRQSGPKMEADHARELASEIEPPASSSVWIDDSDLLFRDLLRGALAHLLAVVRHRVLRASPPTFSLGDQILDAEFNRQLAKPRPEPGPDTSEAERWLAEDLDPFEGIERFYRA